MNMQDLVSAEPRSSSEPSRKRLRTSHACDVCRSRKIRCDGNRPCATCIASDQHCAYGSEASSRGKTDLVLDGVLRIEKALKELNSALAQHADRAQPTRSVSGVSPGSAPASSSPCVDSPSVTDAESASTSQPISRTPTSGNEARQDMASSFENAVLDSMHTSTTESVLSWHHFDSFPSLRTDYLPIFQLEQSRPSLAIKQSIVYPYVASEEVDSILESFEHNVNFWYPTMSRRQVEPTRNLINSGVTPEDSIEACVALLTMALGCASQVTTDMENASSVSEQDARRRISRRQMGDVYFNAALKMAYVAHLGVTSLSAQCLFYVGLYFAFLSRPLQAWEYIGATAAKCMMLLSYPPNHETREDRERTRRIFWSCYILESDYIAELSAGPVSGISRMESSIPLPGAYHTHNSASEEEQSSLYFLACISMRRLLNRVHQLLYAQGTGAALDTTRFPFIVAELQHQLDEWRNFLPRAFSFTIDMQPAANAASGFLRQRYLTCKSVIHRPYLMWLLSGSRGGSDDLSASTPSQEARKNCKACLDACLMHILNLRGFSQTVLVDSWICSLSMACAMLVLLAACRVPSLRSLLDPDVTLAGGHLQQLLQGWQRIMGSARSPSVEQSIRVIHEADTFIREAYSESPRHEFAMPQRDIEPERSYQGSSHVGR
ncbi:hypothetical protein E4U42_001094 [Claviceps africana]|uniref:Zn(2)-C6 fungal-type domain-containing protein n=1 Tax=Claviceps africana TaxID=83212 RepID=A0A8K0JA55_9HYPO|nr:hypothetical protein E4U42_001094 [Claviceps africana]